MILLDHAAVGGGTVVAASLLVGFRSAGRDSELVALGNASETAVAALGGGDWTVLEARGLLERIRGFRRLLRARDPGTLILAIGEFPALVAVIARSIALKRRGVTVVIAEHQPSPLEVILRRRAGLLRLLAIATARVARGRTALSICLSEEQREDLIAGGFVAPNRSVVVPNPCRMPPAPPSMLEARVVRLASNGVIRLIAVGSLNKAKGFDVLLEALAMVDPRYRLTLVGGGDATDLQRQVRRLRLEDRVELLGARTDIEALMDAHDILVLSSRYESFGLVVIEAMVRGLPVVATACNRTLPRLASELDGLTVCSTEDVPALVEAIERAASRPWDARALRASAATLSERHDAASIAAEHLQVLDGLSRRAAD